MKTTRLSLVALGLLSLSLAACGPSSDPFAPPIGGKTESFARAFHEEIASRFEGREKLEPAPGAAPRSYDEVFGLRERGFQEEVVNSAPNHVYDEVFLDSAYCFYFTFPDTEEIVLSSFAGRKVEATYSYINPSGLRGNELGGAEPYEHPFLAVTLFDGEHCLFFATMAVNYWLEIYHEDFVAEGETDVFYGPLLSGVSVFTGERWSFSYDWLIDFSTLHPEYFPLRGEGETRTFSFISCYLGRSEGKLLMSEELSSIVEVEDVYRLEEYDPGAFLPIDVASLR